MRQNSKCQLYEDKNETINQIINEWSKLEQKKYTNRHDWVGKVIHWESRKRLKFDKTNKGYVHKPELVLENKPHNIPWDF